MVSGRQAKRDKLAVEFGYEFLMKQEGVSAQILKSYLEAPFEGRAPDDFKGIYKRILGTGQNANMKANVIGGAIGGFDNLGKILFDFDHCLVLKNFDSPEKILDEVERVLLQKQIRRESRSIWPQYAKTILSAANFLSEFSTVEDFSAWLDFYRKDARSRASLPLLLSQEISGLGFALACDFLKEYLYPHLGKPDVHIKDIFKGAGLIDDKLDDYHVLKAIIRVAQNSGKTPFYVDKLFWLIGSGFFYNNRELGTDGRIGRKKEEFVKEIKDNGRFT